jgi:hypothetical protein
MADQDRRLVERVNLRLVVVEDLGYPQALDLVGALA